jgi:hypothetical protein
MVADFNFDDDPTVLAPSIVFTSYTGSSNGGVLRVIDGRTCETQHTLSDPADRLLYASNNAIVDLDGDGSRPEIIGTALASPGRAGGIVAFGYNPDTSQFERLWYGRDCDAAGEPRVVMNDHLNNNGPSVHDLNDDGRPEILIGRYVFGPDGCALNPSQSYDNYLRLGTFPVVTDIDGDDAPELIEANGIYSWSGSDWVPEPYWMPTDPVASRLGHVAIADLTDVGDSRPGEPEIIVASALTPTSSSLTTGTVRVVKLSGEIIFGPFELPAEPGRPAGRGGPPTVGDFDGDGRREFAVAGGSRYTVFDLDCNVADATAPGCDRAASLPRGVLWSRPSQDFSSNVTGSSVFDFDADGVAEVVYGDECFVRIYRGTDGEVLFSQAASSGTGYEYPVIADVDGDFNSEIIVAMTRGPDCPSTDPIAPGGVPSLSQAGIVVLRDAMDRWAASRPIWNQHAYAVTNIQDNATVPRTSTWTPNHEVPELNNFRMNSQGNLELTGAADLTVRLADDICGASGETELSASVCNRGTNPVADGARVVFYVGEPADGAAIACETGLPRLLNVAECTTVSCVYTLPEGEVPPIVVIVDPDDEVLECREGNNRGVIPGIFCGLV